MSLSAVLRSAADAGVISYAHCEEICQCFVVYESGAVSMNIESLSDDARDALDAVQVWILGERDR
jgi:hypothetical protein